MKTNRRAKNAAAPAPKAGRKAEVPEAAGPSKKKRRTSTVKSVERAKRPEKRGRVLSCGQGVAGQLGLGEDALEKTRFAAVSALGAAIVDVCAGGMHTVCIDRNGDVWTFGCNDEGALGRETSEGNPTEYEPGKVKLPAKAIKVSAGDSHTAALLETGQAFAWGSFRDSNGNLGLTLKGNEPIPVEMLPGQHVVQIASGGDHLAMLTDSGLLFTSGCGEQGQLGRVTPRSCDRHSRNGKERLLIPALVPISKEKSEFDMLWAGTHCTFARDAIKGDIYAWGLNNYRQIGIKNTKDITIFIPRVSDAFAALKDVKWSKICGGPHHTLALDTEGTCYSLGRREYGRLGLGKGCEDAIELTPVPALEGKKCTNISCGTASSFAVTDTGDIYAWGMGSSGQLGTGSEDDEEVPRLLRSKQIEGCFALNISAGGQHTVLLVASPEEAEDTLAEPETEPTAPQNKPNDAKIIEEKNNGDEKDAASAKVNTEPKEIKVDTEESVEKMDIDEQATKKEEKPVRKRGGRKAASTTASNESKPTKTSKRLQNGGLATVKETPDVESVNETPEDEPQQKTGGTQEELQNQSLPQKRELQESDEVPAKRLKLDTDEITQESENDNKMDVDTNDKIVESNGADKVVENENSESVALLDNDNGPKESSKKEPSTEESINDHVTTKTVSDIVEKKLIVEEVPEEKTEGVEVNKTVDPNS